MTNSPQCRRWVHFSGRVQGVGFRYAVRRIAAGFEVTGFVRNLPDGRVELVAEGTERESQAFVDEIGDAMSGYIRGVDLHCLPATGEFTGFEIRH